MPTQAVVLCGGRGTRLAARAEGPKALVSLAGAPLLAHLLSSLAAGGVDEVLLLAGHDGDAVAAAAPALAPPGLRVATVVEPAPRGTAGALHGVAGRLAERFFVVYGDLVAALDWPRLGAAAVANEGLATLVVHRTDHPGDSDVVAIDDARQVLAFGRGHDAVRHEGGVLGNAGIAVLHRDVLHRIPPERPTDWTRDILPALVATRAGVWAYPTCEYVRDIGTPARLDAADADVRAGRHRRRADLALLDRDGVVTETGRFVCRPGELRLLPGAPEGVRRLNAAGLRVVLVTNQAAPALGLGTLEDLARVHAHLDTVLARHGARLDGHHVCPHHPDTGRGEGVPALRGPCACRKPATGLLEAALRESGVAPWRAVVIGDRTDDLQAAHNAALPAIAVDTGDAGRDGRYPARPTWRFADLTAAATWLAGRTPDDGQETE